jgi:hypothetical protein
MSKTIENIEVGECDIGKVFVYHFAGAPNDSGAPTEHRFEVRAGSRTVATRKTKRAAMAVAEALCV